MRIGMNMLLWTGRVGEEHFPLLEAIKQTGFDGVEVPVFDAGEPDHYRRLGALLGDVGLARTVVAVIPDEAHSPISPDAACRDSAFDHMRRVIDCCSALGGELVAGPWFQPLGVFSGDRPSEAELARCAEVHQRVARLANDAGIGCAVEPLNRFEAHLINSCEQGAALAARVDTPGYGILYDSFHANIEEKDPLAALEMLHGSGALAHVHISENDRGTPGTGHAPLGETIATLKRIGYDGWLTIEAFGRGVPELAAATRVWRDFFASPEDVYTEGFRFIRDAWDRA